MKINDDVLKLSSGIDPDYTLLMAYLMDDLAPEKLGALTRRVKTDRVFRETARLLLFVRNIGIAMATPPETVERDGRLVRARHLFLLRGGL
jgi:hypothetical protein